MTLPALKTAEALVAQPYAAPDHRVRYGDDEAQFADLYLPAKAPAQLTPVVVAVHGGCWRAMYSLDHLSPFCKALSQAGYAVYSLEYRRVGNGGGWTNTFTDVATAVDQLREIAPKFQLDINRVVAVGHSAGGHLVLWLGSRQSLPATSPLYVPNPLKMHGVVSLAGVADLAATLPEGICTGNVLNLMGGTPDEKAEAYSHASPIHMLPMGAPHTHIMGQYDDTVPTNHVRPYIQKAKALGDDVVLIEIENVGHFELVMPATSAWGIVKNAIDALSQK
jgi:acetyl esterase/lipase